MMLRKTILTMEFLDTKEKEMIITDLNKMESIVKNNKSLYWDGWTVVNFYNTEKGRTSKYGAIVNGKWSIVKRFEPTKSGWDIPEKMVEISEQA